MDEGLKERLVGAAVLVVLAVIFVPMVLDGPDAPPPAATPTTIAGTAQADGTFRYDLNAPLPGAEAPATSAAPAPASAPSPATVATTAKPAPAVAKPAAASPAPTTTTATKPASTSAPAAAAAPAGTWSAQVGSFSKESTARGVAADLAKQGFKATVTPHRDGKQTLYRVRVGPVADRDAAAALAKRITQKTGQAARPVPNA
jgi:DedD protein